MAFCTNCGATVTAAFCKECGTPAPRSAAAPHALAPARKKTSPLVWVLIIVVGLFVLGGVAVVGTGLFFVSKVKQAGFDPELMSKNPGLALAKMAAAKNPDLEVVSVDDDKGVITLREKSTGKQSTLSFDDVKEGRLRMRVTEEGGKGGTFEFSQDAAKASWAPKYPGAEAQGGFGGSTAEGEGGILTFTTTDSPSKVISYYTDALKSAGFTIKSTSTVHKTQVISAEEDATKRHAMVQATSSDSGTSVSVVYGVKR